MQCNTYAHAVIFFLSFLSSLPFSRNVPMPYVPPQVSVAHGNVCFQFSLNVHMYAYTIKHDLVGFLDTRATHWHQFCHIASPCSESTIFCDIHHVRFEIQWDGSFFFSLLCIVELGTIRQPVLTKDTDGRTPWFRTPTNDISTNPP